jgi:aspartate carbamoyltransferase catalytic subunit
MSNGPTSFLDLKSLKIDQVAGFFSEVQNLKCQSKEKRSLPLFSGERIALLFFEPSTRTRMSFESAGYRCGLAPLVFDGGANTSLEKGETVEDSVLNVAAMLPRFLVIRCGDAVDLRALSEKVPMPIINAGWGLQGHPTQALLDVFTMKEEFPSLEGLRVLILGDVRHSRVAASHFELLPTMGAEVGICGPEEFMVQRPGIRVFQDLSEGLAWAQVTMALRVQFERHDSVDREHTRESYRLKYGLNKESLKEFSSQGLIMHPGPINHGVELETAVLSDSRSRVLQQVTNGVFVREALLKKLTSEFYDN